MRSFNDLVGAFADSLNGSVSLVIGKPLVLMRMNCSGRIFQSPVYGLPNTQTTNMPIESVMLRRITSNACIARLSADKKHVQKTVIKEQVISTAHSIDGSPCRPVVMRNRRRSNDCDRAVSIEVCRFCSFEFAGVKLHVNFQSA